MAGHGPDPEERDHEDQERERGDGLDHADHGEHRLAQARVPEGQDPERDRHRDREGQRHADELQVLRRVPQDAGHPPFGGRGCRDPAPAEKEGRRGTLRQTAILGAAVEVRHRRGVDGAFETRDGPERGRPAPRRVRAVHQDRVVAREEPQIIAQQAQPVPADLGIGGVGVGYVEGPRGESPVSEIVLQPAHLAVGQAVALAQARPPLTPVHELAAETEAQRRVPPEIGDRAHPEPPGERLGHGQGVAVVEAERRGQHQAARRQALAQPRAGRLPGSGPLAGQDLLDDGARVLGVDVDLARLERIPHQPRPAEARPVLDRDAGRARRLRHDLPQDHGFGERLRSHAQGGLGGDPVRPADEEERHGGDAAPSRHRGPPSKRRCARMKRVTKGSAGAFNRSSRTPR